MTQTTTTTTTDCPVALLATYIREHGPVPCVRISSAKPRGPRGGRQTYPYWGLVDYSATLTADGGGVRLVAHGRAASDRRSERLAHRDMLAQCARTGAYPLGQAYGPGRVPPVLAACLLAHVGAASQQPAAPGETIRPYGSGKFRTLLDAAYYEVGLCRGPEDDGDYEWSPRHTLMSGWQLKDFAPGALNAAEINFLTAHPAGAIVTEANGHVCIDYYADADRMWADWRAVTRAAETA